jgi:hypothetical protein
MQQIAQACPFFNDKCISAAQLPVSFVPSPLVLTALRRDLF